MISLQCQACVAVLAATSASDPLTLQQQDSRSALQLMISRVGRMGLYDPSSMKTRKQQAAYDMITQIQ